MYAPSTLTPPSTEPPKRVTPEGFGFSTVHGLSVTVGFVSAKAACARESFNPITLTSRGSIPRSGICRRTLLGNPVIQRIFLPAVWALI